MAWNNRQMVIDCKPGQHNGPQKEVKIMDATEQWFALLESFKKMDEAHQAWNQPEIRLQELEALADEVISQLPGNPPGIIYQHTQLKFKGHKSDLLLHALGLKEAVAKHRRAIEERDVDSLAMTGINLAHITLDLSRLLANLQRQKAVGTRHKPNNEEKAAWLAEGLDELRRMVDKREQDELRRLEAGEKPLKKWKHTDYLNRLYIVVAKYAEPVGPGWKKDLKKAFARDLRTHNRHHLIHGEKLT